MEIKEQSKILRKVRVKARIVNLSLEQGENTVTYVPLTPVNWTEEYKNKWAYYDALLREELERAINGDTPIELFVHRIALLYKDKTIKSTFDLIVEAKIKYM